MHALANACRLRKLALIVPALVLAGCGAGDGPESIANTPATPLPPTAPDFCDPINFELACSDPEIVNFNGGATIIVDNPDPSGINTSDRVARMQKFPDEIFGGTLLNLGEAIDFNEGEIYTVKVWSPRPVTVSFKLEEQGNPAGGLTVDEDHSGSGSWEALCFDFTGQTVPPPVVALTIIFDNGTLGQADTDPDDWTFYYDDITQVASCEAAGGGAIDPDAGLYTSGGTPDLVIPDDYTERTAFASGSVIDPDYADDEVFSPALSVFSGTGSGANVAQVGFIGFPQGFLTRYETVDFKVKGTPGFVIFVRLFDDIDALRLNLTSSAYASDLGDGWFQVSIPVEDFAAADEATGIVFESDDSSATEFRMLMNDIGFSGTGTYVPAAPGVLPEFSLYDRAGAPDLLIPDDYAEITVFGSGAVIDDEFRGDLDFSPVLAVTTGFGYGIWNAQLAYTGFAPGFAALYETLDFKAKGLDNDVIRVRFLDGGDYLDIVLTSSSFATELGNGWYQVSVPLTSFTGVDPATGLLFETGAGASESFTFLLTDVGFSGLLGPGDSADSIIPENVIFATDPTVPVDFEFGVDYTGFESFGSGSVFNANFADDPGFNPVFAVTSGAGYGANVGQFAIVGFDAGFAAGFTTLDFKVKGMPDDVIRVRFLDNGAYVDINLTTSAYSIAIGNGWYQVSIPLTQFSGVDTATALLFESTNTSPVQFTFLLTDFGFSGTAGGAGDHGPGTAGVFTETATESTIAVTGITNSVEFGGNNTVADPASTAIPAFEGDVVLSIDYQDSGSTFGGVVLNFGGVDLTPYDTLNFTVDTSGIAGFTNLTIQIEPPGAGAPGTNVQLSTYTPVATAGNWATYAIPLADFTATNLAAAANLGFWNPVDGGGLAFGTLYVDDVYFSTEGGDHGPGTASVFTETATESTIAVTSITNSIEFGGNNTVADPASTAIPAFEGDVVLSIDYQNSSSTFGGAVLNFGGVDLTAYDTLNFTVDTSGIAGFTSLTIQIEPPGAGAPGTNVQLSTYTPVATAGNWATYAIPLADFTATDFAAAANLGFWNPVGDGGLAFGTLYVDDVYFSTEGGGGGASGELVVNGGFETGDLTGWETSPNGGTITTTNDSASGSFAANLNITVAGNPTLKAANLGAGAVTPGQQVTVSFDWKGSGANGGVVDVRLFSEQSGGGVSDQSIILGGAGFPSDWTTVGPLNIATGPDVSGGVSLQFTAVCGADAGCLSDIYIDNVSIVAN